MDSSISVLGHVRCCQSSFLLKIINRLANSVDPDETAHYEPSHLDLHCLHWYLFWSTGLNGLTKQLVIVL